MSIRGQLFADHWAEVHVHGHEAAAEADAPQIAIWVDALIAAAMAEGITRQELEAEIGDLADLVGDAMGCSGAVVPDRSKLSLRAERGNPGAAARLDCRGAARLAMTTHGARPAQTVIAKEQSQP